MQTKLARLPQGTSRPEVDWVALEYLQTLRSNCKEAFQLNCLEAAMDRLIENPVRSKSGVALAKSALRDARKSSRVQRQNEGLPLGSQIADCNGGWLQATDDDIDEAADGIASTLKLIPRFYERITGSVEGDDAIASLRGREMSRTGRYRRRRFRETARRNLKLHEQIRFLQTAAPTILIEAIYASMHKIQIGGPNEAAA